LEPEGNAIKTVRALNYLGKSFEFLARYVVLCLGTIECSRLLLLSQIGNAHDQVGRYFHDHIGIRAATLTGAARTAAARMFLPKFKSGVTYTPKLEATQKWQLQHNCNAAMAHFPIVEAEDSPAATIRMLLQSIQRRELPPGVLRRLTSLPSGSMDLLRLAYAAKVLNRRALSKHAELNLNIDIEQRPLSDSRVTLSEQKDALGLPLTKLAWKISEAEQRTIHVFAATVQSALRANSVRNLVIEPHVLELNGIGSSASDTYHMMGGTRMGEKPEDSVVDAGLKVHGYRNLYIASCSVFPTGGSSNPTFTLMALTLRLANRLRARGNA
jgi:choline dehydrogenase-like flavoprotein